tara:strand:+ start:2708 stop:2926 length:219 start_codon:yes stop_codon:yes gene_type:complete
MNKLLMALLPSNIKSMLEVSQKIFQNIENDTQRKNIYNFILEIFDDDGDGGSRVTIGEWARLGSRLGILKKK